MLSMTNVNGKMGFYACDNAAVRRHETSFSTLTTIYTYDSIGKLMIQAGSDASRNFPVLMIYMILQLTMARGKLYKLPNLFDDA